MSQSKIKSSLSWLGVGAVIAGCAAAALVQGETRAFAQTPSLTHVQTTVCRGAASAQVATSSRGQAQGWGATALNTLCNGAEDSTAPADCFNHTMTSNSVSWARGQTSWQPNNALRLCAGALDAGRRLNCFTTRIGNDVAWSPAIDQCIAEERTLNVQIAPTAPRITPTAPRVTAPVVTPSATQRAPTLEEVQAARLEAAGRAVMMTCTGPLRVEVQQRDPRDSRSPTHFSVFFRPATVATNVPAGYCWRSGGWGNGALIHMTGEGMIYHETRLGVCSFLQSMRFENGALVEGRLVDEIPAGVMLEMARPGSHSLETRYGGSITEAGDGPRQYNAQRPEYAGQPSSCYN